MAPLFVLGIPEILAADPWMEAAKGVGGRAAVVGFNLHFKALARAEIMGLFKRGTEPLPLPDILAHKSFCSTTEDTARDLCQCSGRCDEDSVRCE